MRFDVGSSVTHYSDGRLPDASGRALWLELFGLRAELHFLKRDSAAVAARIPAADGPGALVPLSTPGQPDERGEA
jgi:hypothetical protein